MAKRKSNGKSSNYWRNKIINERKAPKARFRGRIRSKGEAKLNAKSSPPPKGQKWVNKIKRERGTLAKTKGQVKRTPQPAIKRPVKRSQVSRTFKGRQMPALKPTAARQLSKIKDKLTPTKRVSQPVASKKALNLMKKNQSVVKAPRQDSRSKISSKGISKLKSAALRTKPVKAPVTSKTTPSKGISMLKKNTGKIANQPKQVKKVKQPVIRKGR